MKKQYFSVLITFFLSASLFAQKEVATWYFGKNKGLNFTGGGVPVVLTNNTLNSWEGCASISDNCTGELLFYTNGVDVWDRTHTRMPNGFGLMGGMGSSLTPSSTTQSSLIVPKPGNKNIYYIFTNDCNENNNAAGFRYSTVDMTLNGGMGDISVKNTLLIAPGTEKVTGVHHSNKRDIWVITHGNGNNNFYAYLVTAAGVSAPVVSAVGVIDPDQSGYLKASSNGKKLASCHYVQNTPALGRTDILDFDNTTGVVSNPITIVENYYGCSFSPDCSKLYFGRGGRCDQYDMNAGSPAAILASKVDVNVQPNYGSVWAIQQGIDGKLYCTSGYMSLHVIHNPNLSGLACNIVKRDLPLGGACNLGMTNFVESFFDANMFTPRGGPPAATIGSGDACVNQPVSFWINPSIPVTIDSVRWAFGDPSSGILNTSTDNSPSHTFAAAGLYQVQLIRFADCGSDTTIHELTVTGLPTVIINDTTLCYGDPLILSSNIPGNTFLWPDGSTEPFLNVSSPGLYWLEVTDQCGTDRDSAEIMFEDCEATLFVPNAFIPGISVNNPVFFAKGVNLATFNMKVFDRWGMLLFESNDINNGWDGTYKGNVCQQDVYVWKITYESIASSRENTTGNPKLEHVVGHVTLMR